LYSNLRTKIVSGISIILKLIIDKNSVDVPISVICVIKHKNF